MLWFFLFFMWIWIAVMGAVLVTATIAGCSFVPPSVPVTGGPAGWCDHIARAWNVDAVIGEGGAFYFHLDRETGKLVKRFWFDDQTRAEKRQMMEAARDSVLAEFERLEKSLDLSPLLLLLALLMLATEGWLANPLPLKAGTSAGNKTISKEENVARR